MFSYITVEASDYQLKPLSPRLPVRHGALLRFHFGDGVYGHADCHPWESLGDEPLSEQLSSLKRREATALLRRAYYFAQKDAEARRRSVSLYQQPLPLSNFLIIDLSSFTPEMLHHKIDEGYSCFKVKLSNPDISKLISLMESAPHIRFRLDFNESLTEEEYRGLLPRLLPWRHMIEYIEDPFPYSWNSWKALTALIPLAADRAVKMASDCPGVYSIIKPAVQIFREFPADIHNRVIFTSYLDHPLGIMSAAQEAAEFYQSYRLPLPLCGFHSHKIYKETPFSQRIEEQGPALAVPGGFGYGFDDLLESLPWKRVDNC